MPRVGHGHVFYDFGALPGQLFSRVINRPAHFRLDGLCANFTGFYVRKDDAVIVRRQANSQSVHVLLQRQLIIGNGLLRGGAVARVFAGNHLQHQRRVTYGACQRARAV